MFGGAGNDVYFVDNPGDAVIENANEGNDTVFSTAHFRLSADVEYLVLQGSDDLQGYGNDQSNLIYGNAGNNLLDGGGGGADAMFGGAGNDVYFVDNASDAVIETVNEGNDTVLASAHFRLGRECREPGPAGHGELAELRQRSWSMRSTAIPATISSTAAPAPMCSRRRRK